MQVRKRRGGRGEGGTGGEGYRKAIDAGTQEMDRKEWGREGGTGYVEV